MRSLEHEIQCGIVQWARLQKPPLYLLHAIPNGGQRHILVAVKLKAEGLLAGIPDLFLPVAAQGFHGLYIEVKKPKGVLSKSQKTIFPLLEKQGYAVRIVRSEQEGIDTIRLYAGLKEKGKKNEN